MGVLIIDPNDVDLKIICNNLKDWGYHHIYAFNTIEQAEEKLSLSRDRGFHPMFGIDIALIDVTGGSRWYRLIEKMKQSYIYQDVPIIAMSESSRAEGMSSSFAYGANDFFSKPIEEYELKARVRSGIRLKYEIERRKARERELIEATNQLTDLNEVLTNLSLIDSLTGIPNRRCFDNTVEQEWRRSARQRTPLALIMIDIDYFKQFNDIYGHQLGDKCLQDVTRAIKSQLRRPGDLLARYGGEEFAIVLPNTSANQTNGLCEKIKAAIKSLHLPHEGSLVSPYVSISMGVASCVPMENSIKSSLLIKEADKALYQAKDEGRNCFIISTKLGQKAS